jgi:hypothetical protein
MALPDDVCLPTSEQTGLMDKKLFNHSFPTGIDVMPADAMIRSASSASLISSVLHWSLAMIGASIRIVLLTAFAIAFVCVLAVVYLIDVHDTRRLRSRREAVRRISHVAHAPERRHALTLSSY